MENESHGVNTGILENESHGVNTGILENESHGVNTGILQPAEVDLQTQEESCFGDPGSLAALESLEQASKPQDEVIRPDEIVDERTPLSHPVERKSRWNSVAIVCCFVLLVFEAVLGYFASSVACLTDALRLLSDYIGLHQLSDQKSSVAFRRLECGIMLACVVALWVASGVLVLSAVDRIVAKTIEINYVYMLIAAVLSLTANVILLVMHFAKTFRPRRYLAIGDFVAVRMQQVVHAVGSHGTSVVLFAAAVIIAVQPEWRIADSIAAFVLAFLTVCNTVSIISRCYSQLKEIGSRSENYERI